MKRIKTQFFYRSFNGINEALDKHAEVQTRLIESINDPTTSEQTKERYRYMLSKLLESKVEVSSLIGKE